MTGQAVNITMSDSYCDIFSINFTYNQTIEYIIEIIS